MSICALKGISVYLIAGLVFYIYDIEFMFKFNTQVLTLTLFVCTHIILVRYSFYELTI